MALEDIREERLKKLNQLKETGATVYPAKSGRTHSISEVLKNFTDFAKNKTKTTLAGRLIAEREHGGSTFADIKDGTGKIQVFFKKDVLGESYDLFLNTIDIGDILEIEGELFTTKKEERTLQASSWKILAKSILPLPEKWHGLQDTEERFRKRYLDIMMDNKTKLIFEKRSEIVKKIRDFLHENGFMEVETPVLQSLYGGANARPFKTHLNALDVDLYLRIAPELYLKRLLVGGFERIFEIGRCFRNEGMDREHNPDFTMLECYAAYWDWEKLMDFMEKMTHFLAPEIFPEKWERIEYRDLIKNGNEKESFSKIEKPTFVLHLPNIPLCKNGEAVQGVAQGVELIKAFSEQNDPREQRLAFESQEKLRQKGDEEAQRLDEDFLEALSYGMPPAAGFGVGIDRLTSVITGAPSLRETILFPLMRPKKEIED